MPLYIKFQKGADKIIYNMFNSQNLDMNFIRLTQTRSENHTCSKNSFPVSNSTYCRGVSTNLPFNKDVSNII